MPRPIPRRLRGSTPTTDQSDGQRRAGAGTRKPSPTRREAPKAAEPASTVRTAGSGRPSPRPKPQPSGNTPAGKDQTASKSQPTAKSAASAKTGQSSKPRPRPRPSPTARPGGMSRRPVSVRKRRPAGRARRTRQSWIPFQHVSNGLTISLVFVSVLLVLVAVALFQWNRYDIRAEAARGEASRAASVAAQRLFSYDYRTIKADVAAARKVVTGKLAGDYTQTSAIVAPTAVKNLAVVEASISATSVISSTPDEVVVLLYLNQQTRNKNIKGTRLDQSRIRLTMARTNDTWLIANAQPL